MTPSTPAAVLALLLLIVPAGARVGPKESVPGFAEEARANAQAELASVQAVHIAIRGCSEAATEFGRPDLTPALTLHEAREALARAHFAAREVGVDHQAIWERTRARILEEHARSGGQYVSPAICEAIHRDFRDALERLQRSLGRLGSSRVLVAP